MMSRREFFSTAGKVVAIAAASDLAIRFGHHVISYTPHSFQPVEFAYGADTFGFAYVSDTHLFAKGMNHSFAKAALKAVQDVNAMSPAPDFVLFGGDLAQLGQPEELKLGKEILDELKPKRHMMVGEHDWYLNMGEKWRELFGDPWYSFDHKGVHFVVLNSVVVEDYWTAPNMCHPDASNIHPETYPKFQTQLKSSALLRDMINWCIENPMEGKKLLGNDPKMKAMEVYISSGRGGKTLEPGKH